MLTTLLFGEATCLRKSLVVINFVFWRIAVSLVECCAWSVMGFQFTVSRDFISIHCPELWTVLDSPKIGTPRVAAWVTIKRMSNLLKEIPIASARNGENGSGKVVPITPTDFAVVKRNRWKFPYGVFTTESPESSWTVEPFCDCEYSGGRDDSRDCERLWQKKSKITLKKVCFLARTAAFDNHGMSLTRSWNGWVLARALWCLKVKGRTQVRAKWKSQTFRFCQTLVKTLVKTLVNLGQALVKPLSNLVKSYLGQTLVKTGSKPS